MNSLELKIPPAALALLFAAGLFGLAWLTPNATFLVAGSTVIAAGLAFCGMALALAGIVAFRSHKTTVNPVKPGAASTVVTKGVYRFTRNPMYLGVLLALAAWALFLSNAVAVLLLPVFVAYMNRFQIRPEERALLGKFGPSFANYMREVRRWV